MSRSSYYFPAPAVAVASRFSEACRRSRHVPTAALQALTALFGPVGCPGCGNPSPRVCSARGQLQALICGWCARVQILDVAHPEQRRRSA